jgi:hypothetical protein
MNSMDKVSDVLAQKGLTEADIEKQLSLIKAGTKHVKLLRPCSVGDGVFRLTRNEVKEAVANFETSLNSLSVEKFIPASGAATRMFKSVFQWIEKPLKHEEEINKFFTKAEVLASFEEWVLCADRCDIETFEGGLDSKVSWLKLLVSDQGLDFAQKPKGVLPFHQYGSNYRTPVAEHMVESTRYASNHGKCKLHFTISKQFQDLFGAAVQDALQLTELQGYDFDVSFSYQQENTDTVATNMDNTPVLVNDQMVFRPGGHGALIHNLNNIKSDLVFIKNIDNVCHQNQIETTITYKKAIAGKLLQLRSDLQILRGHLKKGLLDEREIQLLRDKWQIRIPKGYRALQAFLARPIRACGMVANEGEPGGGPFWIQDEVLGESVQIVEQSQVDLKDSAQSIALKKASHFNPVDLVCLLKDLEGNSIDLTGYINADQYFIAKKTINGKDIKALEWPGLWNGSMANWITIFVEVPISTFNPVKEFKDLFRAPHNPKK